MFCDNFLWLFEISVNTQIYKFEVVKQLREAYLINDRRLDLLSIKEGKKIVLATKSKALKGLHNICGFVRDL